MRRSRKSSASARRPRPDRGGDRQRNYRLLLEYDGTRYAGLQVQPAARTVAGELVAALRKVIGEPITVITAGRTDAGVHAEGQVVNFLSRRTLRPRELCEAVNDLLPADINLLACEEVSLAFHARSQALWRRYRYQVSLRRDAFRKRFVWWIRSPLDRERLVAEASCLLGVHDFASFSDDETGPSEVRVSAAAWTAQDAMLRFHITAERFLYRMVRRLVGAMVEVGLHRQPPGLIRRLLEDPRPGAAAAWTAPPSGLFLEAVGYGPERRREHRRGRDPARA